MGGHDDQVDEDALVDAYIRRIDDAACARLVERLDVQESLRHGGWGHWNPARIEWRRKPAAGPSVKVSAYVDTASAGP